MFIVFSRKWIAGILGLGSFAAIARFRPAKADDQDAFQSLHRQFEEPMRRFASRRVPGKDLDDVLQETWLAVWQSRREADGWIKFREWAFSICYRKVQDYWRREYTRQGAGLSELRDEHRAYMPREFEQVELRDSLELFWKSCTDEQREVLAMYYGDGFTLKEIAQVLNRNLNTVKYQFYRAHEIAAHHLPEGDPP